jgi:hypothetical protein
MFRISLRVWALLALSLLAACGGQGTSTATPPTAGAASSVPTSAPATPAPTSARSAVGATQPAPTAVGLAAAIPEGLTSESYHMLGRPDAPVTLVMYSDFL